MEAKASTIRLGSSEMGFRSAIRSAMGFRGMIRPAEPWVGDWIWASPAIALSVLWLGLGVSDESE